jgi:teichuronic acid biosynthesis glycosyltransferase TuaG
MYNTKVDIILPVYNSEDFILDTLQSIINQTYKNWRIIIIDDNSNDSSVDIINRFIKKNLIQKKIIFIKNKKNRGQAFSRNLALKYCSSEFVAFIDSDDTWQKNKLKKQIKFMLKNDLFFSYSDYKIIKNDKIKIIKTPNFFNYKTFIKNTSIATCTMIIKRQILKNIFFPDFKLCEDYYFKCKILKFIEAYKCPGVYSFYRLRNNSLQSSRFKVLLSLWNINKNLNNMNLINNLISILFIVINSFNKYAFR